jgi:MoaA/NifB/PqqE/SkfB family radical SAM enzyme
MHRVENLYPHYKDSVKIEWNLGKRCNYDCSYCPGEIHDNKSAHTDLRMLERTVDEIAKLKNPRISFTGGEPTVHPQFKKLLAYTQRKVKWISVTTNGTRTIDFYREICRDYIDYLVFSLHFEYDWERVLGTILSTAIPFYRSRVLVHIMMLPGKLAEAKHAIEYLSKHDIKFALRPIRWSEKHDVFDDISRYSEEEREFLKTINHNPPPNTLIDGSIECNVNDLLINKTNQFKGWQCRAGLESLMINWDGDVHRATCRVGGSLGNIYRGEFTVPTEEISCTREWCTCAADINISKYKL